MSKVHLIISFPHGGQVATEPGDDDGGDQGEGNLERCTSYTWAYWAKIDIIINIITKTTLILILRIIICIIILSIILVKILRGMNTRYRLEGRAGPSS